MRVAELTDTRLVVELSEWDLWELERSFGVCLPGGTWLIPGRMAASDGLCARADEMRVRGADGAFTGDGLDDAERLVVAEAVCSLWPWVCDSCDVRFVGEDGELWCRGGHHLKVEVRARLPVCVAGGDRGTGRPPRRARPPVVAAEKNEQSV